MSTCERAWARGASDVAKALQVDPKVGLAHSETSARRRQHGPNALRATAHRSWLQILLAQFRSFIVLLLVIAAAASIALGDLAEGIAVVAVILINTAIGFFTELNAVRSMEALRALGNVYTAVRRDGHGVRIPAQQIVVGDVVLLEAGDVVTADLRLVEASRLQANESALTGESLPVPKRVEPVAGDAHLSERASMAFKGTAITRGTGEGVVVAVGMGSELGRISALMEESPDGDTPLERRIEALGRTLAWASLGFVVVIAVLGVATGTPLATVLETAVALAVATVPEGLPIVATIALARGMWRMARQNALIEKLPAVETLGSTNVILTDKTGTLTENQMTVTRVELPDRSVGVSGTGLDRQGQFETDGADVGADPALGALLSAAVLCTDAELGAGEHAAVGDPMEVALLVAGEKAGLTLAHLRAQHPELREEAFDPQTRMMATYNRHDGHVQVSVKGSPEAVLGACNQVAGPQGPCPLDETARHDWLQRVQDLGADGLRVLAVATREAATEDEPPYQGLRLLGLVCMVDPPRGEVRESLERCRRAGIRVVMVTGDQPGTAQYVARAVGLSGSEAAALGADIDTGDTPRLLETSVFARSSPEQKLRLLELHQRAGAVVAMVGDGVNDAPALHRADIGVAMGQRGTQVAREAADMVLQDDRFGTITVAIEQGRVIFDNIRSFVVYLISCNLSEILCVGLASLIGAPLPILPLQILFLNLVTDVFPALALGVSEGHRRIMERPPRDTKEDFLTTAHWRRIAGFSVLLTIPVLISLLLAHRLLGLAGDAAVTISFLALSFGQLTHVFNMAEPDAPLFRNHVTRNPWVWGALVLCSALVLLAVYAPWLSGVLRTHDPGPRGWLLALGLGMLPALIGAALRVLRRWRSGSGVQNVNTV